MASGRVRMALDQIPASFSWMLQVTSGFVWRGWCSVSDVPHYQLLAHFPWHQWWLTSCWHPGLPPWHSQPLDIGGRRASASGLLGGLKLQFPWWWGPSSTCRKQHGASCTPLSGLEALTHRWPLEVRAGWCLLTGGYGILQQRDPMWVMGRCKTCDKRSIQICKSDSSSLSKTSLANALVFWMEMGAPSKG